MTPTDAMINFYKSSKLHGVGYDIRGVVMEEAIKLEKGGVDILKLNIGNTAPFKLFASDALISTVAEKLPVSQGYGDSRGILEARQMIVQYYTQKNIFIDADDIFIGNGVSELIDISLRAFLNQSDEVLIPSPDYPLWTALVKLSDAKPIHYVCDEMNGWNPDVDDIEKKITRNTRAIVIINPNNPTGAVYSKEMLVEIIALAKKHNLLILADEIYERIVYERNTMHYMAQLVGDYPCIFYNGLSKSFRAPGFRVGWMCIHDPLKQISNYKEGIAMLSNMRLCGNISSQWAILATLCKDNEIDALIAPGGRLYEQRKVLLECIEDIDGMSTVTPAGAIYVFPKLDKKKFNLIDDEKLVLDLLHKKHILLVHGRAFNAYDTNHVRIVFLPETSILRQAMKDMKEFLQGYTQ